ncbi:MAG: methionyl-tRNA formyltransferase [Thermoleophilia bacterium]|nr:methionyl-tRNA formyltransferase [Thermoleophilia bacterium]
MRIVVHGQQAFGKAVLEALLGRGDDVVAVYAAPDRPGGRPDPLAEAGRAAGLPVVQPESYRDPAVHQDFRALAPDLQVMAFVTLVIPKAFLDIPAHGTIQYHPSLLPRHRGRSSINWPIIMGETETGLSIFWPEVGLDTGDVLLQKATSIAPDDTLGSVYFDRLFPMGVEALLEAVDLVKAGTAPRIPQDDSLATYERPCERDNARLDWGRPWRQVHDLIRGCDPAPGAWTTVEGQALQVFGATPLPARDLAGLGGRVGEVVAVTGEDITVACADGRIQVARVRSAGGPKVAAGEWAAAVGLKPGDKLG